MIDLKLNGDSNRPKLSNVDVRLRKEERERAINGDATSASIIIQHIADESSGILCQQLNLEVFRLDLSSETCNIRVNEQV